MTSIAIRNFDGDVKTRLRTSVAGHGRSMEEKGRLILGDAFERETALAKASGTAFYELFKSFGGVGLAIPPCKPLRGPTRRK